MKKQLSLLGSVLLIIAAASTIHAQQWKIADGYSVKFDAGEHSGEFTGLQGTINFDEKNLDASKFDMTIDPATINTGNGMKNTQAKGANWFDVEKYPTIAFTSSTITKTATGYLAKGTLNMRGVKKEIAIPFTFINNTFASSFPIDRKDFNLYDWTHEKMSSTMTVSLNIPVTKH